MIRHATGTARTLRSASAATAAAALPAALKLLGKALAAELPKAS
jgi:hypothetical protein